MPHSNSTHHIGTESTDTDKEAKGGVYTMFTILSSKQDLIQITMYVDDYQLSLELDKGISLSIISKTVHKNLQSVLKLEYASATLKMHTDESIKLLGCISIKVCHNGQNSTYLY